MNLKEYSQAFDIARKDFEGAVRSFGLPFEETESSPRNKRATCACPHCENGDASLWTTWISPACLACRTGECTETFFISLKCTKNCYFCFNPNQEDYEYHRTHKRDITAELEEAHANGAHYDQLAVTGGEPLLHKPELLRFIRRAKELYPAVRVRVYTSGDLLDDAALADLAAAGLDELRFSVKPKETDGNQKALFSIMEKAVRAVPDVMVEMPVIPETLESMKELLVKLDDIGLRGVNLLEFCFPLHNAKAFKERGFKLRKKPYGVLYNYWYAGGLPIAGSETEALELVEYAAAHNLRMGVHYCSLDNKTTGQIYQQNKPFMQYPQFKQVFPWLSLSGDDYFLKCVKAFGHDALTLHAKLDDRAKTRCSFDEKTECLAFPLEMLDTSLALAPRAEFAMSLNVLEPPQTPDSNLPYIREVSIEALAR